MLLQKHKSRWGLVIEVIYFPSWFTLLWMFMSIQQPIISARLDIHNGCMSWWFFPLPTGLIRQEDSAVFSKDGDEFIFLYSALQRKHTGGEKYLREAQSNCQKTILGAALQSALSAQRQLFTGRAWMHFETQSFQQSQAHSLEREEEEEEAAAIYAA